MGIDVSEQREVSFNDSHNEMLDTSVERNPSTKKRKGLLIWSIYRRQRHRGHQSDGNPIIHALKQNHGYSIQKSELVKFLPSFYEVLRKTLEGKSFDLIVPMPSSHFINDYFARRIARELPGSRISDDLLEKKRVGEVIEDLEAVTVDSDGLRREITQLLNRLNKSSPGKEFSLKEVTSHRLRKIIQPLKLSGEVEVGGKSVLLIDDLLATGTTLVNSHNLLKKKGKKRVIVRLRHCVCSVP